MRPIPGPGVNLPDGAFFLRHEQAKTRADAVRIARGALQSHSQAGLRADVFVKLGLGGILGNRQIHPSITVVVTEGCAALLAVDFETALLPWHGGEAALAIAAQPQAASGI